MADTFKCSSARVRIYWLIFLGMLTAIIVFRLYIFSPQDWQFRAMDNLHPKWNSEETFVQLDSQTNSQYHHGDLLSNADVREISSATKDMHSHGKIHCDTVIEQLPTLSTKDIKEIKKFVFFIGYPRSGHSIIASMIDAHPNAILAHELNLFDCEPKKLLQSTAADILNSLYQNSYKQSKIGWRSNLNYFNRKGYTLQLSSPQSWQGRFTSLYIIGDKSGGHTARAYNDDPDSFVTVYKTLSSLLKVPVVAIHVVRNPYDMVATQLLYKHGQALKIAKHFNITNKIKRQQLHEITENYFNKANAVSNITNLNLTVLEIHNSDFVRNPKKEMQRVCKFLGLECSKSYLEMCEANTYKKPSKTRYMVEWGLEAKQSIDRMCRTFPFFRRYSYKSD